MTFGTEGCRFESYRAYFHCFLSVGASTPRKASSSNRLCMDGSYLCLALCPLAVYLVALGLVNLSRRPTLVTGSRDITALGLALSGMVIGGPMQLFFPEYAAAQLGPLVWL